MNTTLPTPPTARSWQGSYVVCGMVGIGLALASFAWWWNLSQNQRCIELWGRANVRLIRQAPQVELWELTPDAAADEHFLELGKVRYRIVPTDISQARGLIHARYALTDDPSFDWLAPPPQTSAPWEFGIRFTDGSQTATLVIDPTSRRVRLVETGAEATAIPRIIAGWQALARKHSD